MESHEVSDRAAAAADLAALAGSRAALADRVVQPWWYDVSLGVLMAVFISSYTTRSVWWIMGGLALLAVGSLLLVGVYKRRTGVWLSGKRGGAPQKAVAAFAVLYGAALAGGALAEYLLEIRGAMVVAGIVAGVGVALTSRWWTRLYVAELRSGV
ncbi:hypothetical protein [Geodermatophilus sp. CPCC 206100]|uniref:hypothetical protein n=1 Tax=Geodermatophilus sp. CPCC 206100 TaxID=3020054 RepID=UPI003AFFC037